MNLPDHKSIAGLLCGLILMTASCSPPDSSQMQLNLTDGVWNKYNILELTLPVPDTSARYNAWLDIRVTAQYGYSYLSVIVARPGRRDTLWLPLNPDRAIHSGHFLDYRFSVDTLGFPANQSFYQWCLAHNMPEQTLPGIVTIGLLMKKQRNGQK